MSAAAKLLRLNRRDLENLLGEGLPGDGLVDAVLQHVALLESLSDAQRTMLVRTRSPGSTRKVRSSSVSDPGDKFYIVETENVAHAASPPRPPTRTARSTRC